jgi:hypothetical protein
MVYEVKRRKTQFEYFQKRVMYTKVELGLNNIFLFVKRKINDLSIGLMLALILF